MTIPGYTYGSPALGRSPVSMADFQNMQKSVLFDEQDVQQLRASHEILKDQVDAVLDVWYGFVGANAHLLSSFTSKLDGRPIVIFNIGGRVLAMEDRCSHDDGPVGEGELNGYVVTCPRHGATFDVRTGKALSLPAVIDIAAYPVRIVDGQVEVGIPKE